MTSETASPSLDEAFAVREIEDARSVAGDLFRRKFGQEIPDFPHHIVAFWRAPDGPERPFCYTHFTAMGEILLGGGACVDESLLRLMPPAHRRLLRLAGGAYKLTLERATALFADRFPAIFGYCGDRLADRIDRAVGFAPTGHPHLLALFTRPLPAETRERLIAQANAVGPF